MTKQSVLSYFHVSFISCIIPHLGVPRVPSGRARRREGREDVRLAEGRKPDLPLGVSVRPPGAREDGVVEHDERGAKRLGVEEIPESDRRQVPTVPDEERLFGINELGFDAGGTVLRAQTGRRNRRRVFMFVPGGQRGAAWLDGRREHELENYYPSGKAKRLSLCNKTLEGVMILSSRRYT